MPCQSPLSFFILYSSPSREKSWQRHLRSTVYTPEESTMAYQSYRMHPQVLPL